MTREWMDDAACAGTFKTEVWFDSDPRIALEVCRGCPVIKQCRSWGDSVETPGSTWGVLGGETEQQRISRRARARERPAGQLRALVARRLAVGLDTHRRAG